MLGCGVWFVFFFHLHFLGMRSNWYNFKALTVCGVI